MAIYQWECQECTVVTEISRPMKEYLVPPDDGCSKCRGKNLIKTIGKVPFILSSNGSGFHRDQYTRLGRPIK